MSGECQFCGAPHMLLCDGRIYDNGSFRARVPLGSPNFLAAYTSTCDARMCRACAKRVSTIHLRTTRGCRWDSIDLCPDCRRAQDEPVKIEP